MSEVQKNDAFSSIPSSISPKKQKKTMYYLVVWKQKLIFAPIKQVLSFMSKQEKEEKAKEFWKYYETTQGSITIVDPKVLD